MIAIVNSGVANLTSVMSALERLHADATVTDDQEIIRKADRVILPGVGSAQAAMAALQNKGLMDTLRNLTQPVLGICLGMQILFERSTEGQGAQGLGLIPGTISLLPSAKDNPIPHMGWNQLHIQLAGHALMRGVAEDSFYYYVHSFAAEPSPYTVATTTYTAPFTAVVARDNFMGCQFHPERSGKAGEIILHNFLGI